MRKSLWVVLALLAVGLAQVARADSTEFNFAGTLTNSFMGSNSVTGTFTLDTTTGTIMAFDFTTPVVTINTTNGWSAHALQFTPAFSPNADFVELRFEHFISIGRRIFLDEMNLVFETPLSSFPGTFFTDEVEPTSTNQTTMSQLKCPFRCSALVLTADDFASGSATPVSATEPISLALIPLGLVALLTMRKRMGHDRPSAP